jgi:putative ABC transport system permease protein
VGANRALLFQQLLIESLLMALASSACGILVATFVVGLVRTLPNTRIPRPEALVIDWRVVTFTVAISVMTGVAFGTFPALRISVTSFLDILKQTGGRISESSGQQFLRRVLVGAETGIATVLLIGSLLLLRSFAELSKVDPGFRTDHMLTAYVSLPHARYGQDSVYAARFANAVLLRLKAVPGIVSAAFMSYVPVADGGGSGPVQIEGQPLYAHVGSGPLVVRDEITSGFRKTLEIPLLSGKDFDQRFDDGRVDGALINHTFAELFFKGSNPLGQHVRYSPNIRADTAWREVVGVIGDTPQVGLENPALPILYVPLYHTAKSYEAIALRVQGNPRDYARYLESAVSAVDPDVPVFAITSMDEAEERSFGWRKFSTAVLSVFAGVALALASLGIFAVITYSVSQRTSDIGVRMACGATEAKIQAMILWQGMIPAAIGVGLGLIVSAFVGRYLASLLFRVESTDAAVLVGTAAIILVLAAVACILPARRAARTDPWRALRYE